MLSCFALDLQINIQLIHLDLLPESATTDVFRDGRGAYRRSTREILIDPSLLTADRSVTVAVIAHEVGHAVAHATGMQWGKSGTDDRMGEEFVADLLACQWGFELGLAAERLNSYGKEYVQALETWRDEAQYRRTMELWRTKRNAGLVPRCRGNIA